MRKEKESFILGIGIDIEKSLSPGNMNRREFMRNTLFAIPGMHVFSLVLIGDRENVPLEFRRFLVTDPSTGRLFLPAGSILLPELPVLVSGSCLTIDGKRCMRKISLSE